MTGRLLLDEQPMVIQPSLAKAIGLNEAIVVQQIHYWLVINEKAKKNFNDGHYWTYNSLKEWHEAAFSFWSYDTVRRTFNSLEKKEILLSGNYNRDKRDRTKWYTINYEKLDECTKCIGANCTNGQVQDAPMNEGKMPQPLPETSTESTSEISNNTVVAEEAEETQKQQKNNSSNTNKDFQEIVKVFNQNIHPITSIEVQRINDWMSDVEPQVIILAIEEAVVNNARNMRYINGILNAWFSKGIRTKDGVMAHLRNWQDKKQKATQTKEQSQEYHSTPSKFVNFKQREWDFDELEKLEFQLIDKQLNQEDKEQRGKLENQMDHQEDENDDEDKNKK